LKWDKHFVITAWLYSRRRPGWHFWVLADNI